MYNDNAHYYCLINDISAGGCNQSSLKGDEHINAEEDAKLLLNLYGLGSLSWTATFGSLRNPAAAYPMASNSTRPGISML
ncbi:hypothetical protein DWB63_01430 [Pseudodesulfovibrio sp. S3]|nr:hypothetical protein [Pseudodesulfovibrio sp. S3-i]RWU07189.1 hypothetical protein DWB63_01430 [Pseudodesulfovibrio sp. S3]